ncbi:MAG TPA: phosphotransferase [Anaerolineales bacterium]|nr:phosphotransferase [Anaerolineales bacterium]
MLEKPDIPDELIVAALQDQYGLDVSELTFLPLGADPGTSVYRVPAADGETYFLKLRKSFEEITVTVPIFLKTQGVREIISPLETISKRAWGGLGEYTTILYPFIHGQDGFEKDLTDKHRRRLGAALKAIHAVELPSAVERLIPRETFSGQWREMLKSFLAHVQSSSYLDTAAANLAEFIRSRQGEIMHLITRTEELASMLRSMPLESVLCHTDIHGGNILISDRDELYLVDWDNPLLAPRERDLMFIGGGIDNIWKTGRDQAVFYERYGETKINGKALAYYRYERIIEDLAVICEQLLWSDEGGADREQAYKWFTSNFEPGGTVAIAGRTDRLLT